MDENATARKVFDGKVKTGRRRPGRHCVRWKVLADLSIPDWKERAKHRTSWRGVAVDHNLATGCKVI